MNSLIKNLRKMLFDSKSVFESKSVPMYNEPTPAFYQGFINRPSAYSDIDKWIEVTPEAIAIVSAIITDMKPYSYRFMGPRYKVDKATNFAKSNNYGEEHAKCLWDWIVYGDDYLWKGIVDLKLAQSLAFKSANAIFSVSEGKTYEEFEIKADEDAVKEIKWAPANTMNIDHDKKQIIRFRQIVGSDEISWSPEQIIHGKLLTMKGKVYGFSPMQACLNEMNTIGYIKDYAGNFFKNGGVPDWMFILPKENAGSKNHNTLIQMLQKYKHPENKHGNLVFTGEVEPTKMNDFTKDMEFRQLAVYLTGVIALAFNMPMSRVAAIIGSEVKVSTGSDDLANEGYWNKIDEMQTYREQLHNSQLWEPYFGVKVRFDRGYKQNEVREVQRRAVAVTSDLTLNNLLYRHKKQLSLDYYRRMYSLEEDDLEESKEPIYQTNPNPTQPPNQLTPGREAYSNEKKKQVNLNQDMSGM